MPAAAALSTKKEEPSFLAKCVGNAEVVYSKATTDMLTDLAGTFMVLCFAVYFTVGGYLFYRETVLSTDA